MTWAKPNSGFAPPPRRSEGFGLVASSEAQRLKPHAIDIRIEVNPIHWFLDDAGDTKVQLVNAEPCLKAHFRNSV